MATKEKHEAFTVSRTHRLREDRAGTRITMDMDMLLHRLDESIAREHASMDDLLERVISRLPR